MLQNPLRTAMLVLTELHLRGLGICFQRENLKFDKLMLILCIVLQSSLKKYQLHKLLSLICWLQWSLNQVNVNADNLATSFFVVC